ncbi:MAG TPA: hypothetical protein VMV27_11475 [Candidatus Binataceae bacterium]|nr:hypothetical protein [Candidatus Binataceae bacterium]
MNEMNQKKLYIWRLAAFLASNDKHMSGEELAEHLNRNKITTGYGEEFKGGVGTYKLISQTYRWVHDELGLDIEADKIAEAFVTPDGGHAWEK